MKVIIFCIKGASLKQGLRSELYYSVVWNISIKGILPLEQGLRRENMIIIDMRDFIPKLPLEQGLRQFNTIVRCFTTFPLEQGLRLSKSRSNRYWGKISIMGNRFSY